MHTDDVQPLKIQSANVIYHDFSWELDIIFINLPILSTSLSFLFTCQSYLYY